MLITRVNIPTDKICRMLDFQLLSFYYFCHTASEVPYLPSSSVSPIVFIHSTSNFEISSSLVTTLPPIPPRRQPFRDSASPIPISNALEAALHHQSNSNLHNIQAVVTQCLYHRNIRIYDILLPSYLLSLIHI